MKKKVILDLCSQHQYINNHNNKTNKQRWLYITFIYVMLYTLCANVMAQIHIRLWLRASEKHDERRRTGKVNDNTAQDVKSQADEKGAKLFNKCIGRKR